MASTFYNQIAANKRNSVLLAIGLILLLSILGLAIGYGLTGDLAGGVSATVLALGVGILVSLVSYFQGDSIVLAASGAKAITEEEYPQLFNVIRELTIAGNLPMPKVYLIDDTSMNALRHRPRSEHASIAVTSGLLSRMDREEVQGVIAHELSHVRNFDIRFSLRSGSWSAASPCWPTSSCASRSGGGRGRSSDNGKGGGGLQLIILAVALVLAILARSRPDSSSWP